MILWLPFAVVIPLHYFLGTKKTYTGDIDKVLKQKDDSIIQKLFCQNFELKNAKYIYLYCYKKIILFDVTKCIQMFKHL